MTEANFIANRMESKNKKGVRPLFPDNFVSGLESYLKGAKEVREVPREQRFGGRPGIEELFVSKETISKRVRNLKIREAHIRYGYTLAEIGRVLGLHYSTISKIVNEKNSQSKT